MWRRQVAVGMALCMVVMPHFSGAQQLVWKERNNVSVLALPEDTLLTFLRLKIIQKMDYSFFLSGGLYHNWGHDLNANQVILMQDLVYQCQGETKSRFRFTEKVTHHLGFQYLVDSLSRFHIDDNQFETRMEYRFGKKQSAFLSALVSTRLFNLYNFSVNDSSEMVRTLAASFLTPLTALFTGGIQLKWPLFGSLSIGVTSAKLTWVRDQEIYETLETDIFHGVPKGKEGVFEYGLSLQLLIDHDLLKWLHWDCDLLIFKNTNLPPDISLKNNLGIKLAKLIRIRIQTRIYYEEQVKKEVQLENFISAGVVVSL